MGFVSSNFDYALAARLRVGVMTIGLITRQKALESLGWSTGEVAAVFDIEVGGTLMTPFGIAKILAVDARTDYVTTDLGSWDLGEVRGILYDRAKYSPLEWLTSPTHEVRTSTDTIHRVCDCACKGCTFTWSRHKLTRVNTPLSHNINTGDCRCSFIGCVCMAHPLGEVDL